MSNNRNVFFKELQEIINSLELASIKNQPNADVGRNSAWHDVAIQPPAQELAVLYENLKVVQLNQSVFTANETAIEKLARNQNLLRKGATPSTGLVTIGTKTLPTFDIFIPAGTKFATTGGREVITLTDGIIPALADIEFPNNNYTVSPFFFINTFAKSDTDTGERFGVDIPVITTETGQGSAIDVGQINQFSGAPIPGINEVINRVPVSGGLDRESVFSLQTRIVLSKLGRQLGAKAAYKSVVMSILNIEDALVVGQGDPLMKRDVVRGNAIGGKVDIYVIGSDPVQTTQRVQFLSNESLENQVREPIVLENQPVISINNIIGGEDGQFPVDTFTLQKDNSPFLKGSSQASDSIVFSNDFDAKDQTITITYTYNKALSDAQERVDEIESINADIAIFEAIQSLVDFNITVRARENVVKGIVEQEVINTINDFLTDFRLGQELKVSEIIALIQNIDVVNEVISNTTTFGKRDTTGAGNINLPDEPTNISFIEGNLQANEYLRPGSIIVIVLENN